MEVGGKQVIWPSPESVWKDTERTEQIEAINNTHLFLGKFENRICIFSEFDSLYLVWEIWLLSFFTLQRFISDKPLIGINRALHYGGL